LNALSQQSNFAAMLGPIHKTSPFFVMLAPYTSFFVARGS
jgi:hypothetical protein